nr:unnamed protein product [Callosobruchus chinensis]
MLFMPLRISYVTRFFALFMVDNSRVLKRRGNLEDEAGRYLEGDIAQTQQLCFTSTDGGHFRRVRATVAGKKLRDKNNFSRCIKPRLDQAWGVAAPTILSILDAVQRRAIGDPALCAISSRWLTGRRVHKGVYCNQARLARDPPVFMLNRMLKEHYKKRLKKSLEVFTTIGRAFRGVRLPTYELFACRMWKCGEAVETAKHVIFDCPALCRRRSSYLEVIQEEGRQYLIITNDSRCAIKKHLKMHLLSIMAKQPAGYCSLQAVWYLSWINLAIQEEEKIGVKYTK